MAVALLAVPGKQVASYFFNIYLARAGRLGRPAARRTPRRRGTGWASGWQLGSGSFSLKSEPADSDAAHWSGSSSVRTTLSKSGKARRYGSPSSSQRVRLTPAQPPPGAGTQ